MNLMVKIRALFFALVVLLSTMTFTIDMHFCGESMVSISLLGDADSCEMRSKKTTMDGIFCFSTKKKCCSDEQFLIEAQDIIKTPSSSVLLGDQQPFVFLYTYIKLYECLVLLPPPPKEYPPPPPLIKKAIYKLYETYLI